MCGCDKKCLSNHVRHAEAEKLKGPRSYDKREGMRGSEQTLAEILPPEFLLLNPETYSRTV